MVQVVRSIEPYFISKFVVTFNRNRKAVVKVYSRQDLEALTRVKTICGLDITVQTHSKSETPSRSANHTGPRMISWGKFFSHDLANSTEEEILEVLKSENPNILSVTRIHRWNNNEKIPTKLIKVKFDTSTAPDKVFCLHRAYEVSSYTPPPMKCRKCHRFGHWTTDCNNVWACPKCGKNHEESLACTAALRCIACGQGHSNLDPKCPRFQKEKEIVELSYEKNVSFPAARTLQLNGTRSWASLVKESKNAPAVPLAGSRVEESYSAAAAASGSEVSSPSGEDSNTAGSTPAPPQVAPTPITSTVTTGTETPENIEAAIAEAIEKDSDKILISNKSSKAVYIKTNLHKNFAKMAHTTQAAVAKIEALPPSSESSIIDFKNQLEVIIKAFLQNMSQLIDQIQNV